MHQSSDPEEITQLPQAKPASIDEHQESEATLPADEQTQIVKPLEEREELSATQKAPLESRTEVSEEKAEPVSDENEPFQAEPGTFSTDAAENEDAVVSLDEDENEEEEELESPKKYWLISGIAAVLLIAVLIGIAAILTHGFRPEPATSWLTTTSANANSAHPKTAIFVHWKNQDGKLNGEFEYGIKDQGVSYSFNGTYDYQTHKVVLNLQPNGTKITLKGMIKDNALTLNDESGSSSIQNLTFHGASEDDYESTKSQLALLLNAIPQA